MASTSSDKSKGDKRNAVRPNLRDHPNFFELPEDEFIKKFRFSREAMLDLCQTLEPHLSVIPRRKKIPVNLRVLAAMYFFGKGSYQSTEDEAIYCLSQRQLDRCIEEVSDAINKHLSDEWIRFPSQEEYLPIQQTFMEKFNMPGVIGVIDGTHVEIKTPEKKIRPNYENRMGFYSKNVSIICDSNYKILNVYAEHGGAFNDEFIWQASPIRAELQRRYEGGSHDSWLLGDSAYNSEEPFLMTPVKNAAVGSPESRYNEAHRKARSAVQHCITMWKARFQCLHKDSSLNYTPQRAAAIINACAVLHNIAIARGLPVDIWSQPVMAEDDSPDEEAIALRDELVKTYF